MTTLPVSAGRPGQLASLEALAAIPEEEIWLASQKSVRTRRAYRQDVAHFMRRLGIATPDQLHQVDHRAVIAWERIMREEERAAASTVRRRLAALSSLFKHLVRHGAASRNPVVDVARPAINREEGSTAAFSKAQARKLLDAPPANTVAGLRDRAILSVGLQVGLRRAEIAGLAVGDLHQNRATTRSASPARAAGVTRSRSIHRQRYVFGNIWRRLDTAPSMTGRCSVPCGAMPRRTTRRDDLIPM